jgi:hypothetical protein
MLSRPPGRRDPATTQAAPVFRLYQKSFEVEEITGKIFGADEAPDYGRIRCPLCRWRPRASSRWYCIDCGHPEYFDAGCGTAWNTFDTRGRCPGCGHRWRYTACLSCDGWSLHEDWYERGED